MGIYLATLAKQFQPLPLRLWSVQFDFNSAKLPDNPIPDSVLTLLKRARSITLDGHTDSTGTRQYNERLSLARARAVAEFLRAHGIAPTRMTTRGYGSSQPAAPNDTEQNRALNRRVEIRWEE
jgi:outer membrane protein OmpA-like peptidoglycan-associated protein